MTTATKNKTPRYLVRDRRDGMPEIRNGTNTFSRPVIVDDRNLHVSGVLAAKAVGASQGTVSRALVNKRLVKGHAVRLATMAEVEAMLPADSFARVRNVPRRGSAGDKTPPPPVVVVDADAVDAPAFVGVEWPDGGVTVRLAGGGGWEMSRASVGDLPVEIAEDCAWPFVDVEAGE